MKFCLAALLLCSSIVSAQSAQPSPGVTFAFPMAGTEAFWLDDNRRTIEDLDVGVQPGFGCYLDSEGNILMAYKTGIVGPGFGGGIRRYAFDGTLIWDYIPPGTDAQHHDIAELPSGNVLICMTDTLTSTELIALGRNPATTSNTMLSERLIEVEPTGPTSGRIVWEWRARDHFVQDFDVSAPNFDVVANRPERIDVNHGSPGGLWFHLNGIDYNPHLDQIAVSLRKWNEIWIIDHSTTTAEAAGTTGGRWGKGGDLLYRWGDPSTYNTIGTQHLAGQHDINWIEPGRPGAGNLICFNNQKGSVLGLGNASAITEFIAPTDALGNYILNPGVPAGPAAPVWEYMAPTPSNLFSPIVSGAQRLPNGNTLVTSGVQDWVFEIGLGDQIVWQATVRQSFKARRYERSLFQTSESLSLATGGSIDLEIVSSSRFAGDIYLMLGTTEGISPGFTASGFNVPLNPTGAYFDWTLNLNGAPLFDGIGSVDGKGRATARFELPAGVDPSLAGLTVHHAYGLANFSGALAFVSEARPITLVP